MATENTTQAIPQPAGMRVLGNIFDVDARAPVQSLIELAKQQGPIFRLDLPNRKLVIVSSYELVNELCDEQRFDKLVWAPLRKVRHFTGDGLFTAWTFEPNWHKAHNILLPNFSMRAMQGYMPMMVDIAEQLVQKWERLNPDDAINVPDDMTRLTLDTIGLCGFDYRFNSFYREEPHPFVQAMVRALGESLAQLHRLPVQEALMFRSHRQYEEDIAAMNALVDKLIQERKANPEALAGKKDLLSYMLTGVDKQSGEGLDDVNIRNQIITFLIAGHETTSGLLSFALYFLMHNPEALRQAYEEVDRVLGTDPRVAPTYQQVQRLTYVQQVLKEALRLWPTAPAFALYPYEATTLGGRYAIDKDDELMVLIPALHRDPAVWGEDAEAFRPERFAPERERELPANAYKPFGNGQRACIGRQFALQEATLVLGMILQRFELIDHANYQLEVKESLTLKPDNLTIRVRRRAVEARRPEADEGRAAVETRPQATPEPVAAQANGTPLTVLYGSNLGTAEGIAQQIADDATARGFAVKLATLDEYAGKLPTEGALAIVSSSYNGLPPDNATAFVNWLREGDLGAAELRGVRYTVFGCGDHNWATTFQAVPTLIDEKLATYGAERIFERGEADAADDFDGQFQAWYARLWPALGAALELNLGAAAPAAPAGALELAFVAAGATPPFVAAYGARPMAVLANRELQQREHCPEPRSTRHIELALPEGASYRAGDHLGVLPCNSPESVRRVLARFRLDGDAQVVLRRTGAGKSHLPLGEPVRLADLLTQYVELQEPATRSQIATLAAHTECPPEKRKLEALANDDDAYREEIFRRRVSLLELLERFQACELPFAAFLELLPPLKPRYYSISSSPLANERALSITVAVVEGPARSGNGQYGGVASTYLARQAPGATVYGFVRSPGVAFRPPSDPRAPMIMVGPGTGLAPFRGFLQERAALRAGGAEVGPALLFFGCRNPQEDFIYEDELRAYDRQGIAALVPAFSRAPGQPKVYVQNNIAARGDDVWALIEQGATIYVCGDAARMAPEVRATFGAIYQEKTGATAEEAEGWLARLEADGRYLADVWASS